MATLEVQGLCDLPQEAQVCEIKKDYIEGVKTFNLFIALGFGRHLGPFTEDEWQARIWILQEYRRKFETWDQGSETKPEISVGRFNIDECPGVILVFTLYARKDREP